MTTHKAITPDDNQISVADSSVTSDLLAHHVVPVSVYLMVFAALLVLTGLTVWVALYDLGEWNFLHTPLALLIAVVKATLVVLFFMHGLQSGRLTWAFIAAGVLFLAFLIALTFADYLTRNRDAAPSSWSAEVQVVTPR
jgi:cytochrome c oxidase subunit 4